MRSHSLLYRPVRLNGPWLASNSPTAPMWLDSPVNVKLSAQRALLGRISPEVRAITVECGDGRVVLRVYHDGPLAPETEEEFEDAVGEMMADVPSDEFPAVGVEFGRIDAPTRVAMNGWPVFARKESAPE